jgi:cell division protein FtsZ
MSVDNQVLGGSMDIDFEAHQAKIVAIGCGGGGCNTINRLTAQGVQGAKTMAINTDAKHLTMVQANDKMLLGRDLTRGLGAGGFPETGKQAALESKNDIKNALKGCDLLFLTCGLGGGTGTGASPVVAQIAKEMGAIVIAAVTLPFKMEGTRIRKAEDGLQHLREVCDTVITLENERLIELAGDRPISEAFGIADGLISTMIKGISETISQPSLVNLDYADVRTIMKSGGVATVGIGESSTKNRAEEAIQHALNNPLLEVDYHDATGALVQVIGGDDMRLDEISKIGETVSKFMNEDAMVMWGARVLPEMRGKLQVITIITGVSSPYITGKSSALEQESKTDSVIRNQIGIPILA